MNETFHVKIYHLIPMFIISSLLSPSARTSPRPPAAYKLRTLASPSIRPVFSPVLVLALVCDSHLSQISNECVRCCIISSPSSLISKSLCISLFEVICKVRLYIRPVFSLVLVLVLVCDSHLPQISSECVRCCIISSPSSFISKILWISLFEVIYKVRR